MLYDERIRKMKLKHILILLLTIITILVSYLIVNDIHKEPAVEISEPRFYESQIPQIVVQEEDLNYSMILVEEEEYIPDKEDVEAIARTLYGECRGIPSDMEKAAVAWCVLNRLDAGFEGTIIEVVSAPKQFVGYDPDHPLLPNLVTLAEDVMIRWHREKEGEENVGRVLPPEYLWFTGDGSHNWFLSEYRGTEYWDWEYEDVYASQDYEKIC